MSKRIISTRPEWFESTDLFQLIVGGLDTEYTLYNFFDGKLETTLRNNKNLNMDDVFSHISLQLKFELNDNI